MGLQLKSGFPFFGWARSNAATFKDPDEWFVESLLGRLKTSSGITVNPMTALGASTVFACVNLVARQMATTPLHVYEKTEKGSEKATSHPLYSLLHDGFNDQLTAAEAIMAIQGNLTLRNNAFALIRRAGLNRLGSGRRVIGIDPLDPSDVRMVDNVDHPYEVFKDGVWTPRERSEVLHLRGLSLAGSVGFDTVSLARDSIGLAIALQDEVARFFANGAKVGTILHTDANLNSDKAEELRTRFDERHKGTGKAGRTAILSNGLKLLTERFSNTDAQSKEQRDFQNRVIAQWFNVPLHKIQINDSIPRANNEEQNRQFITDTLRPYAVLWEQSLTKWTLSAQEREKYFIGFNLEGLLRGNTKDRYLAYQIGRLNGWLSVNEIRSKENMNSIGKAGDTYIEPMNHQPVGSGSSELDTSEEEEEVE